MAQFFSPTLRSYPHLTVVGTLTTRIMHISANSTTRIPSVSSIGRYLQLDESASILDYDYTDTAIQERYCSGRLSSVDTQALLRVACKTNSSEDQS